MKWDTLSVEREDGFIVAKLNRPEKLNALNKELLDELDTLLELIDTERNLRALAITGSGSKSFCVGLDVREQLGMNEKDMLARIGVIRDLYRRIELVPVPVIAAIEGLALGAGFELALACDLRVASTNAMVGLTDVDLAVVPGCGGTQRLIRLVGSGKALEWVLLARRLSGNEAYDYGIVHQVVPPGECMAQVRRWVNKIMESGPLAIREAKHAIRTGSDKSFDEGMKIELQCYKACLKSSDRLEGIKSFIEKRKPTYQGK